MTNRTVTVQIGDGFDARSIAMCVQTAGAFESSVHLTDGVKKLNAKSIMGLMAMGLALGDSVTVVANGPDEEAAADAMASFLEGKE